MGHGEHGSRRVGAVLRRLTGPAELLTPLLGGRDAAELMAMREPEPGYEYRVEPEQSDFNYLRRFFTSTMRKA